MLEALHWPRHYEAIQPEKASPGMPAVVLSPILNGWQGLTLGGLPLSGGFINTYQAGTSTPTATYTTNLGNVANANPIVLGPDGRPPFEIWLILGQAYRFTVTDSLSNLMATYDNISDAALSLLGDSTNVANGDALVAVKRTFTSAVATTEHIVNEWRTINVVSDCGADPTNTSDSTFAIQAAINSGRDVVVPAGTYKIGSSLTIPTGRKGLTIRGEYLLTKFEATFAGPVVQFPSGLTTQYIWIDGITFQASGAGDGAATGISGNAGLAYVMLSDFTRCQFSGSLRYGFAGNFLQGTIDRCGFGSDRTPTGGKTFKPIKMFATDSFQTTIRIINCEINSGNDDYVCEFSWGSDITIRGGAIEGNSSTTGVLNFSGFNLVRIEELWAETNGAVPFVKTSDGSHAADTKVAIDGCFLQGNGSGVNDVVIDTTSCTGKFWEITDSLITNYTHVSLDTGTYDIQSRILARYGNKSGSSPSNFLENQGFNHYAGTVTNDSAAVGDIGEFIQAQQFTSTNFPATTTYGDGASIALTPGDWDVSLQGDATLNGATMTGTAIFGISSTTGNSGAGLQAGDNQTIGNVPTAAANGTACIANYRVSLSANTTYYAKVRADYSAGNPQYRVRISARRRR